MIKRRFYKLHHGDRDDASDSDSSSSSDFEPEAESTEESEDDAVAEAPEESDAAAEVKEFNEETCFISSGYESEDSSANEVDVDLAGFPAKEDDSPPKDNRENLINKQSNIPAVKNPVPPEFEGFALKKKSIFKCRLCPKIVCFTEENLRAHMKSKKHFRSEKLLKEGKLKSIINSDGEIEEDEEEEEAEEQDSPKQDDEGKKKNNRGRQRQRERLKRKQMRNNADKVKVKQSTEKPAKKRLKK